METQILEEIKDVKKGLATIFRTLAWAAGAVSVLLGGPAMIWTIMRLTGHG